MKTNPKELWEEWGEANRNWQEARRNHRLAVEDYNLSGTEMAFRKSQEAEKRLEAAYERLMETHRRLDDRDPLLAPASRSGSSPKIARIRCPVCSRHFETGGASTVPEHSKILRPEACNGSGREGDIIEGVTS